MPESEQRGAVLEKNPKNKEILQDKQLPISLKKKKKKKKKSNGPMYLANHDLWLPNMVSK